MQEYSETNQHFIALILKWKKHFIVVSVAAIVLAAVFSGEWLIKSRYKSMAIVYPANIISFSSESTTEQLLQVFQSTSIRDSVIKKFGLVQHYGVDTASKGGRSALIKTYQSFVTISKTEFESVEIEVEDTNPELACNMVNEIIAQLNNKIRALHRNKSLEVADLLQKQMKLKKDQLDSLNAGMQELRVKYQILDYNIQVKEVTKEYLKAINSGKSGQALKDIDVMLRNLEQKGGEYYQMKVLYDGVLSGFNSVRNEYDNVLKDLNKNFTYTYVVTHPTPSDKKSYPVRWLIVAGSLVSANMFLFFLILINDRKKETI